MGLIEMSMREVAKDWYREHVLPLVGVMTWPQFRQMFTDYFLSFAAREALRARFMSLRRDSKTVDEYTTEFVRLSRFAPEISEDEMRKNHQYVLGLGYEFISLTASCGDSFSKLVDRARQLERISTKQSVILSGGQGGMLVAGSSSTQQPSQQQMRFVPGYGQGSGSQKGRFNRRTNRRP